MWEIVDLVCKTLGISDPSDVWSHKTRHKTIIFARRLIVHIIKRNTYLSYPEIAYQFGRKNHSTYITQHQKLRLEILGNATVGDQIVHDPSIPKALLPLKIQTLVERMEAQL